MNLLNRSRKSNTRKLFINRLFNLDHVVRFLSLIDEIASENETFPFLFKCRFCQILDVTLVLAWNLFYHGNVWLSLVDRKKLFQILQSFGILSNRLSRFKFFQCKNIKNSE